MKKELIKIIKKAGKILKKGYYSNKDVTFKAKKRFSNKIWCCGWKLFKRKIYKKI